MSDDRQRMNQRLLEQMNDEMLSDPVVYEIKGRTCVFSHVGRINNVPDLCAMVLEFYFMPKVLTPDLLSSGGLLGPFAGSYVRGHFRYSEEIQPLTALAHKLLLDRIARAAGLKYQGLDSLKIGGDTDYSDKISYS